MDKTDPKIAIILMNFFKYIAHLQLYSFIYLLGQLYNLFPGFLYDKRHLGE